MAEGANIQVIEALMKEQHSNTTKTLERMEGKLDTVTADHQALTSRVQGLEFEQEAHKRVMARLWTFASGLGVSVAGMAIKLIFF
jgi:hypothetical protein